MEFDRYFGTTEIPGDPGGGRGLGLLVVPETNHVFSPDHGQRALFETVEEFVRNAIAELAERQSLPLASNRSDAPQSAR